MFSRETKCGLGFGPSRATLIGPLTDDRPDGGVRASARGSAGGLKTDTIALELSPEWEDAGSEGSSTSLFWTKDHESGNVSDKKNEVQKPITHQVSKELVSNFNIATTGYWNGAENQANAHNEPDFFSSRWASFS
jgi:hypothetical protein